MKSIVIGGNIDFGKPSSVVYKIAYEIVQLSEYGKTCTCNGYLPKTIKDNDLTIWMPDISNESLKDYPVKDKGSVLICSKVMRDGYTKLDAVSRIFKMHGNAVIAIYKDNPKQLLFELIDALGNTIVKTTNIRILVEEIEVFYKWIKDQIRYPSVQYNFCSPLPLNKDFMTLNTEIANIVEESMVGRYFGNYSTRCMKLFPSCKDDCGTIVVSPRDSDKRRLETADSVPCFLSDKRVMFSGNRKPSIDTGIQLELYKEFKDINYMIHGHALIKSHVSTTHYYPCGDLREYEEISSYFKRGLRNLNLKNHGFILASNTIEEMRNFVSYSSFISL